MHVPTQTAFDFAPQEPTFETLVLRQAEGLRAHARYLCRDRGEAEDLVQEAILKALLHRDQFQPGTNLKAWLRTILRNSFLLRVRNKWREAPYDPDNFDRSRGLSGNQGVSMELDDVRRALSTLPRHFREVLILASGGSSYDEISYIVGCPLGTVKSRINRARGLLQAVLAKGDFRTVPCSPCPRELLEADYASMTNPQSAQAPAFAARP